MNLPNHYFKVEMKIFFTDHIHIEKNLFRTKEEAEKRFTAQFKGLELGYLQSRYDEYSIVLAECDIDKQLTQIHKTRKAPI